MRTCAPYALRGDISIGISGPRDLTVRREIVRPHGHHAATRRARHIPHSTLVTIAMRPSAEARRSQSNRISKKKEMEEFFRERVDRPNRLEGVSDFSLCAQALSVGQRAGRARFRSVIGADLPDKQSRRRSRRGRG